METTTKRIFLRIVFVIGALLLLGALLVFSEMAHGNFMDQLVDPFRSAIDRGDWLWALVLLFAAGIATSLTPCVYPMITITVSVFGARQTKNRWEAAGLSTAFVLGIAALFTPLGVMAALTGGVFGAQLANPWVLAVLALFFVLLGLSMLGVLNMALPSGLATRLSHLGGTGFRGAFMLGVVSSVIAAPCTGPVLGFLLPWIGSSGDVSFGLAGLFVYSLGLGLLFWFVGTFAVALPKSGMWLEWIKSGFAIVMFATAFYFVRDYVPGYDSVQKTAVVLVAAIGLLVVGIAFGAVDLSFFSGDRKQTWSKALGIVLTVVGIMLAAAYLQALPPGAKIRWHHDFPAAQALAQDKATPMLVDFGASWCAACGELDRKTFADPRVVAEARRFIAVKVDLSPNLITEEKEKLLASYGQRGLPLVVIHGSDGHERARIVDFVPPETMLKTLRDIR